MASQGRITNVPDIYNASAWRTIMRDLDRRFQALERLVGPYTVENFTPTRTLDMSTAAAADIGNFLATLVNDLQQAGRLSKP